MFFMTGYVEPEIDASETACNRYYLQQQIVFNAYVGTAYPGNSMVPAGTKKC